jgi:hypothetical protein
MIPNPEFRNQPKMFWAYVRTLSQQLGYTVRGKGQIKVPTFPEMRSGLNDLGLDPGRVADSSDLPTALGAELRKYFEYRAVILNDFVKSQLMDANQARTLYEELQGTFSYTCPVPMNKQTGIKHSLNTSPLSSTC